MTYTFYITTASSITYQVYPLNWFECSLVDEKEANNQFYRRKFEGSLTFGGKKLCPDFTLFNGLDPCENVYFFIMQNSDIYWEGYFSTAMGEWDLDASTFTVTPLPLDDYSDWDDLGDVEYNFLNIGTTVTVACNGYSYTRNRWLTDVIDYLAGQVFTGSTIATNFFTYATDYVTLQPSKLLYLTIAQKSDIKNPVSSDPATVANLSWNELMEILRGMFNVYWTYDASTNIVRVEHISYFTNTAGLDLRTQEIGYASNKYKYSKEKMPKHEYWYFMESKSADFKYGHAWYDSLCVDQDPKSGVSEYRNRVTTEVEYIQQSVLDNDGGAISNEGFVILANYLSGGSYYTYQMPGLYDTVIRFNMPLAWSYLLHYYHRHDRVLLEGYFNLTLTTFLSARKTKEQLHNAIICHPHDIADYDPTEYMTTELGETYFSGEKGYVKKAVIKPYGEVNFTLEYGPIGGTNEGVTGDPKSLRVIQTDLQIETYLSEANVYDTYYSIWTNSDTCDVIMIPAGTMYQMDFLTQINPIVTISYNFTDSSLTGWDKSVNGSTSYTTHTDLDCSAGSPPPPGVPAVPTIIGFTQYDTCGPIWTFWAAVADATYYVLQRNPDYGLNNSWITVYSGVDLSYADADAGSQTVEFTYRLAAGNISGLSGWSVEESVMPMC